MIDEIFNKTSNSYDNLQTRSTYSSKKSQSNNLNLKKVIKRKYYILKIYKKNHKNFIHTAYLFLFSCFLNQSNIKLASCSLLADNLITLSPIKFANYLSAISEFMGNFYAIPPVILLTFSK